MNNIHEQNLNFSQLLRVTWNAYRQEFKSTLLFALGQGALYLIPFGVAWAVLFMLFGSFEAITDFNDLRDMVMETPRYAFVIAGLTVFILMALYAALSIYVHSAYVIFMHAALNSKPVTYAEAFKRAGKRFPNVFGYNFVLGFVSFLIVILIAGVGVVGVTLGTRAGSSSTEVLTVISTVVAVALAFILFYIVWIYLALRLSLTYVELAVKDTAIMQSVRRSWAITHGKMLKLLGYFLVLGLAIGGISVLFTLPLSALDAFSQLVLRAARVHQILPVTISLLIEVVRLTFAYILGNFVVTFVTALYINWSRHD